VTPFILLASVSLLHVGDCWRDRKYSGLSNTYGSTNKILEIGDNSVVYTSWNRTLDDWSFGYTIDDKKTFEKQLETSYEKIACPIPGASK
jgi:hypothetical protein